MPKDKTKKSKHLFLLLRIAVIVGGITWGSIWISRDVGWDKLGNTLLAINLPVFALALAIFVLSMIVIGLRWWLLLRAQSIYIPFWAAVRLYFLGWFYNNFMPSSVGGDLIRAWYVTRHTEKRLEAALSVFVDRAVGLASTLAIAAFFYFLFLHGRTDAVSFDRPGGFGGSLAKYRPVLLWTGAIIVSGLCALSLFKSGRSLLRKAWAFIRQAGLRVVNKVKDSMVIYCKKPIAILAAFGLTVLVQLSSITGFWLIGNSMGVTASIKYYYVFFTLVWVLGAVPISVGGAVVMEAALAYLFIHVAGLKDDAALTLALCQRIIWVLASLPGALIHLIGAHLPKDLDLD
ncbi:MAG: lysylphosphatidylglycerol synthase transmembrane domain-containing protein [Planctomycetota bacterium]|jgi:uncharacterized protein (TIRG00374 family)